jgi:cell division protein FtsQ
VSRRLPDSLVIDWSSGRRRPCGSTRAASASSTGEGVVLDAVAVDRMPDLPLLIGPVPTARPCPLRRMIDSVPT